MEYIVGVDGGGSKTALAAYTLTGELAAKAVTGGTNYNFGSVGEAAETLASAIASLCPGAGELFVGFGDCSLDEGAENPKAAEFEAIFRSKLAAKLHLVMRSDAFMALYGHTRGGEGVVMISGASALGLACDRFGKLYTAGGWGRLTGDEGSGYYIALSGIKAALRAYDRVGEPTELTKILPSFFGCGAMRELIGVFYGEQPPEIAPFAEAVAEAAQRGDKVSQSILRRAAWYLAGYTKQLIGKLLSVNPNYENKSVGIYGSVLLKNGIVRGEYERMLRQSYPELVVAAPAVSPEEAAAMYARDYFFSETSYVG